MHAWLSKNRKKKHCQKVTRNIQKLYHIDITKGPCKEFSFSSHLQEKKYKRFTQQILYMSMKICLSLL
jgi:hypothetical protein